MTYCTSVVHSLSVFTQSVGIWHINCRSYCSNDVAVSRQAGKAKAHQVVGLCPPLPDCSLPLSRTATAIYTSHLLRHMPQGRVEVCQLPTYFITPEET